MDYPIPLAWQSAAPAPCEVDQEKVVAECKEGVLTVTLPKSEAAKAKKVKVKS